ncbi:hypothetical protein F442_20378 [Phytophthora nicotianae P10297]|uniref:Uncharacterized protein n=1 Tax=Phytophthora nicotianae P10297 TaxID=1317064 RepID=W2Y6D4_PHYNI|nr:hypothetical protein F442_20378 [Phytophthora nicotianae P10297]
MVTSEQVSELAHSFEADSVSPPTCTTCDRSNTAEKSGDGDNTEEDVPTATWSDPCFLPVHRHHYQFLRRRTHFHQILLCKRENPHSTHLNASNLLIPCLRSRRSEQKRSRGGIHPPKKTMLTTNANAPLPVKEPVQPRDSKPSHYSAHETRMSLAQAFAHNAETKIEFLEAILEEEKRQWNENHAILKLQMLDDLQEHRTARKQELLIELIRQQKRPEEITMFMKLAE